MKNGLSLNYIFNFLILLILASCTQSCTGISVINGGGGSSRDHYSAEFLKQIQSIENIYKDGDKQTALSRLNQISDDTITTAEIAKKYNFLGVIFFSRGNLDKAIENFQHAKQHVEKDYSLASQINLNLASSYYKANQFELSRSILKAVNLDYFNSREKKKYYKLNFTISNQLSDSKQIVNSLIYLMDDHDRFSEVEDYQYKELLIDNYRKLTSSERVYLLNKYEKERPVVVAYLGKQEVLQRFYQGDKSGAQDVVSWLSKHFLNYEEVKTFIKDYEFRVENFSKINTKAVGVVVPLSKTKYSRYGKTVLSGINTALSKTGAKLKLFIKDNKNNKYLAKKQIQELVMKHHVSVIIGGLFPGLATEEYLEAKKYGVLFISLSQVYLPREEKSHLLIEMQGSVESQVNALLKSDSLEYFGKRLAILYPWSDRGKSYINEFWGHHNSGTIQLSSIGHYEKGVKQFTDPVQKLLWLKNPRERKEELMVWKEIRSLEKKNFRIINEMPPIVDFDWVFIPSLPKEAIQIIPTFAYYDAKKLKFVGGPSWINKNLKNQSSNLGKLFYVGNDTNDEVASKFQAEYKKHNGKNPHLVDTISYESMVVADQILSGQDFDKREMLERRLINLKNIKGLTSGWTYENGLWLKDMDIMRISSKGFTKLEYN